MFVIVAAAFAAAPAPRHLATDLVLFAPHQPSVASGHAVTAWHPTCFPGDDREHTIRVDIAVSVAAVQYLAGGDMAGAVSLIDAAFTCVNALTVPQMHVRFVVASATTVTTACDASSDGSGDLSSFATAGTAPVKHLFDWCPETRYAGMAYVGDLCAGANSGRGVTYLRGDGDCWTLAHELGHTLGAEHPFDAHGVEVGDVGGVMDYANPLIDGTLQYDSGGSRDAICEQLSAPAVQACAFSPPPPPARRHDPCAHPDYSDRADDGWGVWFFVLWIAIIVLCAAMAWAAMVEWSANGSVTLM